MGKAIILVQQRHWSWIQYVSDGDVIVLPSKMGLASSTCCSIQECCPLMAAKNCRISLVLSVFPAPDSPLTGKRTDKSVNILDVAHYML